MADPERDRGGPWAETEGAAALTVTRLDLGSGPRPAAGYVGVDLCMAEDPSRPVVYCDLWDGRPWPFESGSVTALRAWHVIEHIPHVRVKTGGFTRVRRSTRRPGAPPVVSYESIPQTADAFYWFFNEAYRIAAPGCRFELAWPHPLSDDADKDPEHARRIPAATLHYLSAEGRRAMRVHCHPVSCDWRVAPGSVVELAPDAALAPFTRPDGSVDIAAARRSFGVFNEIRAVLCKP